MLSPIHNVHKQEIKNDQNDPIDPHELKQGLDDEPFADIIRDY